MTQEDIEFHKTLGGLMVRGFKQDLYGKWNSIEKTSIDLRGFKNLIKDGKLLIKFGKIDGNFVASNCDLTSLENFPDECKELRVNNNSITKIDKKIIANAYDFSFNLIESIDRDCLSDCNILNLKYNSLKSLRFIPNIKSLLIHNNDIDSYEELRYKRINHLHIGNDKCSNIRELLLNKYKTLTIFGKNYKYLLKEDFYLPEISNKLTLIDFELTDQNIECDVSLESCIVENCVFKEKVNIKNSSVHDSRFKKEADLYKTNDRNNVFENNLYHTYSGNKFVDLYTFYTYSDNILKLTDNTLKKLVLDIREVVKADNRLDFYKGIINSINKIDYDNIKLLELIDYQKVISSEEMESLRRSITGIGKFDL